ncbi:MAG: LPS export ABC transporter permease LptF [Proteobacteria bacterium]|nr:LPS export ABC transporter permease LptF [Pseudomonadota bacterium]
MKTLDKYLMREFLQSVFAALVVLLMVMVGAAFADVLRDIATGRMPAGMMFAQLGLVMIGWMPLILPLALMLGLLLAMSRLYRDAEMPVLASIGVGPRRLLGPLLPVILPMVAVIALCSLWLAPWSDRYAHAMIKEANRNMLIAGLEPGKFIQLPGANGVVYVGDMTADGSRFRRVFIYREKNGRMDVTTSSDGTVWLDGSRARYLRLTDGFEVEGPLGATTLDYRLLQYKANDVKMPDRDNGDVDDRIQSQMTSVLLAAQAREAKAELHWRIAMPLVALALSMLAIPLSRSPPRQARYGRIVTGVVGYLLAVQLMMLGKQWLDSGKIPVSLGLWWLVLPLLMLAFWAYFRDGNLGRLRR